MHSYQLLQSIVDMSWLQVKTIVGVRLRYGLQESRCKVGFNVAYLHDAPHETSADDYRAFGSHPGGTHPRSHIGARDTWTRRSKGQKNIKDTSGSRHMTPFSFFTLRALTKYNLKM
jgi:hypothetical protein